MTILQNVSYTLIFEKPPILYIGVITFFALLLTASNAILNFKGMRPILVKWHPRVASIAICFARVCEALGLLECW